MTGNTEGRRRRRILIVDAPMQRMFVVDVALVPALAMGMTTMIVALFCSRLRLEAENYEVELGSLVPLLASVACFVFASGFAIVFQAVKISNRVAGPQVNIRRTVDRVLAGDHGARVKLRERDFMKSAAADINRLLDHFTARRDGTSEATGAASGIAVEDVPAPPVTPADTASLLVATEREAAAP